MILTIIFLIALIVTAIVTVVSAIIGGLGFVVIFGDIIVFGLIIYWIVKKILKKEAKDKESEAQK